MQIQMQILQNFQVSSISFSHTHNSFTEISMTCIHINQFWLSVKFTKSLPSPAFPSMSLFSTILFHIFTTIGHSPGQKHFCLKPLGLSKSSGRRPKNKDAQAKCTKTQVLFICRLLLPLLP